MPGSSPRRAGLVNSLLVVASVVAGLLILEGLSRILTPLGVGTRYMDMDGAPTSLNSDQLHLKHGETIRQISMDFDSIASITPLGHRGPAPTGPPDVVFIGDSFTFGVGLNDNETIVARYCSEKRISCANLGMPASGTFRQTRILETYLRDQNWRPRRVVLVMYASIRHFFHGNDFVDSLEEESNKHRAAVPSDSADGSSSPSDIVEILVSIRNVLLTHSNLARVFYYKSLQYLRSEVSFRIKSDYLKKSIDVVAESFKKIDRLSKRYEFSWAIVVIPALVELSKGTTEETVTAIRRIAPVPVTSLAPALLPDPKSLYFPADGHLNAAGAARVAEYLGTVPD